MRRFGSFWRSTLRSGGAASLLSTALVVARSRRDTGSDYAGVNAISHWIWGPPAYRVDAPSWPHTATALAIHHASSVLWAALFELLLRRVRPAGPPRTDRAGGPLTVADVAATAAVVTAVAALTDLRLVPKRLSPGFENRLRPGSVALVYVAFGCGLLLAGVLRPGR
jgi:hypothetical protein